MSKEITKQQQQQQQLEEQQQRQQEEQGAERSRAGRGWVQVEL